MNFILASIRYILNEYKGKQPLSVFLKAYYKSNKQLGSRDRKAISEAVYIYYRVAYLFSEADDLLTVINAGLEICNSEQQFLKFVFEKNEIGKAEPINGQLPEFLKDAKVSIFTKGINRDTWLDEQKKLPELFIRIRKNQHQVFGKLKFATIPFELIEIDPKLDEQFTCLSIKNSSQIDRILKASEYVVQDLSSQKVSATIISKAFPNHADAKIWDVCAGAGGKSIYLKDYSKDVYLLATDNRKQILENLKQRFQQYGISGYNATVLNLTDHQKVNQKIGNQKFDLIMIDAPCTGSGTWKRTPEQFHFFKKESIQQYHNLQYEIVKNAQDFLAENGKLAYITCSVFEKENELLIQRIEKDFDFKIISQQLIQGDEDNADTLFVSILGK